MAYALGFKGYFGAKKQAAYTDFVIPDNFARIQSHSIAKAPEFIELDLIGNSRFKQVELLGNKTSAGDAPMPVNVDDVIGLYLKDMLGSEAYTAKESATIGQHIFTPQSALGLTYGFSAQYSNDPDIADNVWNAHGGHVIGLAFAWEAGQPLIVTPTLHFRDAVKGGADQTPVNYGPNRRYLMCHTGTALLNGIPAHIVSGAMAFGSGAGPRWELMSDLSLQPLPGMYDITGQVVLRFQDLSEVNDFLSGTPGNLELFCAADTVGSTILGLTFALDNIYWRGETPKGAGTGEQLLTLPFVSKHGTAANLARATLVNSFASAY